MGITVALLAGPLGLLAPTAAHADTGSATSPPVVTDPEAIASAQARATGQSVVVGAQTTPYAQTTANPDGSFTMTDSIDPSQVDHNGTWVPADSTLQQNTDGTWAPKAAVSSVVFSGGGTSPLATVTSPTGQAVSISWPSALPTPTVTGASATYPDVLPGVDLQMTATTVGGYSEQLIVKTAAAAANPALATIRFTTATSGLTLDTNAQDALQAVDTSNTAVFTSTAATMWSTPTTTSTTAADDTTTGGSAQTRSAAVRSEAVTPADSAAPTAAPADAFVDTPVAVSVSGNTVDLTPPPAALTGSDVTYPVVIDPDLTPAATDTGWTWVANASNDKTTGYWQGSQNNHDSYAHTGFDDWCSGGASGCPGFGITRSMFEMGSLSSLHGKHIMGATFGLTEQGPTSSWSGDSKIDLYGGGGISPSTDWNNQDVWSTVAATATFPAENSNTQQSENFDVTSLIASAAASGYDAQTMVMEAHDETQDTDYRYFIGNTADANHPVLTVSYYSTPDVPSHLSTTNGTTTDNCSTAAPGTWINASDSRTITLNASVSTPDKDTPITSDFWDRVNKPALAPNWTDLNGQTVNAPAGDAPVVTTRNLAVTDGEQVQWQAYATEDGGAFSSTPAPSASLSCWFSVDLTAPSAPSITTNSAPGTQGGTGSLGVTATDGGVDPSGVASFSYNMNGTSLTAGGDGMKTVPSTGSASIPLTADHWGTNTVWIATNDAAGNQSQPVHFDFYAAPTAFTPGTAGDLDGKGKSDLAVIDTAGNIRLYSDPLETTAGSTSLAPTAGQPAGGQIMIPAANAPNRSSFTGAIVAHNGSFSGQTCDDLVIVQSGSLDIANDDSNCSPSTGWTLSSRNRIQLGKINPADAANYNSTNWSSVQQAVVLPPPAGTSGTTNPMVVTQEDDNGVDTLWMTDFSANTSVLLATGSYWGTVTIMSPGLVDGSPALWVRDNTTGALTQYTNVESWHALTTPPAGTSIASGGYSTTQYPMITTNGPAAAGTGPTLWAVDSTGRLTYTPTTVDSTTYAATAGTTTAITPPGWSNYIQNLGTTTTAAPQAPGRGDIWPLTKGAAGYDIGSTNPATSTGTVSYTPDANSTADAATVFDGTSTALTTTTPAVDTSGSYTVSAWVNLHSTTANSVFLAQGDSTTSPVADGLQLYYSATAGSFAFGRHVSSANTAAFTAVYATTTATAGTWTHLVGVFNATTNTMTLYINGTQAATGTYTGTLWDASGALQIGRGVNAGSFNQYANAAISQVGIYNSALTAAQVTALYNNS